MQDLFLLIHLELISIMQRGCSNIRCWINGVKVWVYKGEKNKIEEEE
jgi:hypothetical protein